MVISLAVSYIEEYTDGVHTHLEDKINESNTLINGVAISCSTS
jgi:hypothetical protein